MRPDIESEPSEISPLSVFERYRKILARVVSRIVKPHDIEDILQETYVRIYQASKKGEIHHPKSFMVVTARNIALNHVTRADAMNHVAAEEIVEMDDSDESFDQVTEHLAESPESIVQGEEEFLIFCRAVRELPSQCRKAFILRKVYSMSQREIAMRLEIAESTVEKHIAKGLHACGAYMAAHGYARKSARKPVAKVAVNGSNPS
ncbi:MAG: RNA polymerase sigma factor [Steroidobacteraceae bacterium]